VFFHLLPPGRNIWSRMPALEESDSEGEDDGMYDEDGEGYGGSPGGKAGQFTADADAASARDVLNFGKVLADMVTTGFAEGHPASSLLMEIKGYKFAQNKVRFMHFCSHKCAP
jgi:TPP-dependent 2-oxoacid decarboxylase